MAIDVLEAYLRLVGVGQFSSGFRQVATSIEAADATQMKFNTHMIAGAAAAATVTVGLVAGLKRSVDEAGRFEARVASFGRLFGQGEGFARGFLKQLQDLSLETTFSFSDMAEYAQRLRAMGFEANQI